MLLMVIGLVGVGLGVMLDTPGLTGYGILWVVLGGVIRWHARRVDAARAVNLERAASGEVITEGVVTDGMFVLGLALVLAVALPSLAVGLLEIGISSSQTGWRWLPLVVGGVALLLVLLGLLGALTGARAPASAGGVSDIPARATVLALHETGRTVGPRPVVAIDLLVEPEGRSSFETSQRVTVPVTALGSLRPGVVLDAAVPADRAAAQGSGRTSGRTGAGRVRLDWDALTGDTPPS